MAEKGEISVETYEQVHSETKDLFEVVTNSHLLRNMLLQWLIAPIILTVFFILILIGAFAPILGPPQTIQVDLSILSGLNSDLFIATLTLTGITLGIVPIISFFYIGELKEAATQIKDNLKARKKATKMVNIKKDLDVQEYLNEVLVTNMKKTIIAYTEFASVASIFIAGILVLSYFWFGMASSVNSGTQVEVGYLTLNILISLLSVFYLVPQVPALWSIGLSRSGYKVNRFKKGKQKFTIILPEE
ncbi:MAG TPA: hypothetical protein VJY36_03585 [Candidatus Bathyarchaeia archaeon]|nr:hypothetical protein [Candidatus Bathyarchaeia archaeon]